MTIEPYTHNDDILVLDYDDGVIVAKYLKSQTLDDGTHVNIYRKIEYYHSLEQALSDIYGVKNDKTPDS